MTDDSTLSETFYSTASGLYDIVATAPGVTSWRVRAVDTLDLDAGDTVVEMGCGTGANFPALREAVGPEGRVVGVDLVGAMLERARRRIVTAGWENVHVVRGDATRPPIQEADAVISTFVVGMLPEPDVAVRRWIRCVAPGGRVTLLNAGRTDRLVARPLNIPLRVFVRATAPKHRLSLRSPTRILERRWADACGALFEGTTDHHDQRLGLGLVSLAGGRVSDTATRPTVS
jgi:ubiquinone/menaquinone biosynthesis C-methylase UbiE